MPPLAPPLKPPVPAAGPCCVAPRPPARTYSVRPGRTSRSPLAIAPTPPRPPGPTFVQGGVGTNPGQTRAKGATAPPPAGGDDAHAPYASRHPERLLGADRRTVDDRVGILEHGLRAGRLGDLRCVQRGAERRQQSREDRPPSPSGGHRRNLNVTLRLERAELP